MTTARECGGCTACCKTHRIPELAKVSGEWCPFCTAGEGCSVYRTVGFPKSCRKYRCAWLLGWGLDEDRPDRSFVVADTQQYGTLTVLVLVEFKEGGLNTQFAEQMRIGARKRKQPVLEVPLSGEAVFTVLRRFAHVIGGDFVFQDGRPVRKVCI